MSARHQNSYKEKFMKRSLVGIIAAVALVGTIGLTGTAASAAATLKSSGSSFANGIMQACKTNVGGVDLTYTSTGSGTGRSQFVAKTTDFGMTDGLFTAGSQPANFVYVPLVGGPVAIVLNVPGVKTLNLTGDLIGKLYTGKITKWNDAAIAKENKGVKLPALAVQPVYRSGSSGTSENFTNYLAAIAGNGWVKNSTFASANTVVGTSAATSTVLVTTVKSTAGAFGYADLSDVAASGLNYASIKNGAGQFIKPDVRSAKAFLAVQRVGSNGVVGYDYKAPVRGAYPLSLISYAIAYKNGNKDVQNYLKAFVNTCAPTEATKLSYVAIDGKLKSTALSLIDQIG
jgi:phosphate transport system substrate-binding protein